MKTKNWDRAGELEYVKRQTGVIGAAWECYALPRRRWRVWIARTPILLPYARERGIDARQRWAAAEWLRVAPALLRDRIPGYAVNDLNNALPRATQYKLHVCVVSTVRKQRFVGYATSVDNRLRECLKSAIERCHQAIRNERGRAAARRPQREPGYYVRLAAERIATALDRQHLPTDNRKWIAVEIECVVESRDRLRTEMARSPLLRQHVTIKSDSSLSAGDLAVRDCVEVVVCAPRETYRDVLVAVCAVIAACNGAVNKTCGLHVHLDQRDVAFDEVKRVYSRLASAQPLLRRFVSESRLGDEGRRYCANAPRQWSTQSRYRVVNACAYQAHRTIEVRLHQGSVDATKIANWVALLIAIADCQWSPSRERRVTARWLDAYGVSPALRDYWLERMSAFGRTDAPPVPRARVQSMAPSAVPQQSNA